MSGVIERLGAALEGRYRIERELGAGGMATVFLAEDLKHDRKVALKVLKPELAAVVGAERFLAEIKTTAGLQHPHILPLHDSGEADTFLFYVMPYLEGESLREKLDRERQLPVDEAVRITGAVASGLDYAHRQGVVHRDIKPANILLQDGEPVIADFGIALAIQQAGGGRLTETGLSLGTPYYMSPEQATADRDPDARSDVYSLGCVLYEMLTGEPPFTGNTAQSILGKILTAEAVAPRRLRSTIPPHVEATTQRALAKLPADRFASAAEFTRALADPEASAVAAGGGRERRSGRGLLTGSWVPWSAAAVAGLAALWVLASGGGMGRAQVQPPVVRASLELAEDDAINGTRVAISADGTTLSVLGTVDGVPMVLVRRLDQLEFAPVEGTTGVDFQSLSPDGRSLVFEGGAGLMQTPLAGGRPVTLDPEAGWGGADWGPDGAIYYTRSYRSGLFMVRPGGDPEALTEPAEGELAHWWPQVLPGGEHLLFTAFRTPIEVATLAVISLENGERKDVLRGGIHGTYVSTGHLVFARGEALHAVPFDLETLSVEGDPTLVVDDVSMDNSSGLAAYDISEDGTLVYVPASEADAPAQLVWVDRDGTERETVGGPARYAHPTLSPDGQRVAVTIADRGQSGDVWILDFGRGTRTRVGARGGLDFQPVWTPDGSRIIFGSESPVYDLWWAPADRSSPAAPLAVSGYDKYPGTFLPDGKTFLYRRAHEPRSQLWRLVLEEGAEPEPVYTPDFDIFEPVVSPGGRWVAYASADAGPPQVYISALPDPSRFRRQVSTRGGRSPRWTREGRELVYMDGSRMMAVDVDPQTGTLGQPRTLFDGPYIPSRQQDTRNYDVTPDGRRFLLVKRPSTDSPRRVVVVTNFHTVLQQLGETRP